MPVFKLSSLVGQLRYPNPAQRGGDYLLRPAKLALSAHRTIIGTAELPVTQLSWVGLELFYPSIKIWIL